MRERAAPKEPQFAHPQDESGVKNIVMVHVQRVVRPLRTDD
jgi:hypothetical protein